MGYYSDYSVHVTMKETGADHPDGSLIFNAALAEGGYENRNVVNGDMVYGIKWYSAEQNLREISLAIPEALIRMYRQGEEHGDETVIFFWRGQSETYQREQWNAPDKPATF